MDKRFDVVISRGAGKIKESILRIGCMGIISEVETLLTIKALEKSLDFLGYSKKRQNRV
jgi:aspartate aminotransferase-like enzyme